MTKRLLLAFLLFSIATSPGRATATTLKELQLGLKTLNYMLDPPRGRTPVAIIYDSRIPDSDADAHMLQGWIGSSVTLPNTDLTPVLVDIAALERAQTFRVAVVANGLAGHYDQILDYARKNGTATISSDLDCVRSGKCAIGVSTSPVLDVFISHAVTTSCGIGFQAGFRMMIKEL